MIEPALAQAPTPQIITTVGRALRTNEVYGDSGKK